MRWLAISPGSGDESVLARLELLRPLGSTYTLCIAIIALAAVFYCYHQATESRRIYRIASATLRLLLVVLLIGMIGEFSITLKRAGLPSVVVLIDDSESMNIRDRYSDETLAERIGVRLPPRRVFRRRAV